MNRIHPAHGHLLPHLRHITPLPTRTASRSPERTHRSLVGLGRVLLALGPTMLVIHVITDAYFGDGGTLWTYTLASYEAAVITIIIGIALVGREPPTRTPHESR